MGIVVEPGASDASAEDEGRTDRHPSPSLETALTRGFLFCDLRGYTAFVEQRGHDANIDPRGRLVIGNDDNGRVLYLDRDGHEVDAFNGGACDVTVDSAGNTYVGGCGSDAVTVFDPSHRVIGRWQGPDMPLA
jgi:hypothetical protein